MKIFASLSFIAAFVVLCSPAHATQWKEYTAKTGLFEIMMPHVPDEEVTEFQVSDDRKIISSEMVANIDQRPFRNSVKSYRALVLQSFGPAIKDELAQERLVEIVADFEKEYLAKNAVIRNKVFSGYGSHPAAEILLSYPDEELGVQSIRKRFVMTPSGLFEQIVSGSESIMDTPETRQYWKSFDIKSGALRAANSLENNWEGLTSPLSIFAIRHPPVSYPYVVNAPDIQSSANSEFVSLSFNDPVMREELFYNVYGYIEDRDLKYADAVAVLAEKHIARHGRDPTRVSLKRGNFEGYPMIEAQYQIQGPAGFEYLQRVDLRAVFIGRVMMVQEFLGSDHLMQSQLRSNLRGSIRFTPQQAGQP